MPSMIRLAAPLLAISLFGTGCGSSGGGSDNKGSDGVNFTEDTTLNENLYGVWMATKDVNYVQTAYDTEVYSYKGTIRETIYITEDPESSNLRVFSCHGLAYGVENGSTTIAFELEGIQYTLDKNSNTNLSGTLEGTADAVTGNTTLIKVMAAPTNQDDLVEDLSLGTINYTYNNAEHTFNVQCYHDAAGTETYTYTYDGQTETDSGTTSSHELSNFYGWGIRLESEAAADYPDYRAIDSELPDAGFLFENDSDNTTVEYSASGTDTIHFTFSANYTSEQHDATSDSAVLTGSATLNF